MNPPIRGIVRSSVLLTLLASGCQQPAAPSGEGKAAAPEGPAPAAAGKAAAGGAGGSPAAVRAGGNAVEKSADGTIRARNAEGAEATVHADGAVDAKAADGTQARIEAKDDGSFAVRSDKGTVEQDAAGKTKIVGPKGQKVEVGPDGSVKVGGVAIPQ